MCPNQCAPTQLAAGITALAAVLAEGKSPDEIALLGVAFAQLGDTLATISLQKAICEKCAGGGEN